MDVEEFKSELQKHNIFLSPIQLEQFHKYYNILIDYNKKVNLTSITNKEEVYLKHFFDSLIIAFYVPELVNGNKSLCDVGSGAGFPSIPLKIVFPKLTVTIIDSLNKRINFLSYLVKQLQLSGVDLVHSRAEDAGKYNSPLRAKFDFVTARAVAPLNILCELCLPLVKIGGYMIALKGGVKGDKELADSQEAIEVLGGKVVEDKKFKLGNSDEMRQLILIKKVNDTPKNYPRKAGKPKLNPIGTKK